MYYTSIISAQNTHKHPYTDVTPIMQVVSISNNNVQQDTYFQVEVRGIDGSYSRSFTSKTDWNKSI